MRVSRQRSFSPSKRVWYIQGGAYQDSYRFLCNFFQFLLPRGIDLNIEIGQAVFFTFNSTIFPILMGLRRWGLKKFATKKREVNAPLGGAIKYLLNNWKGPTEFLKTPGVPLDNSAAERLLKRAILHRKNSLFYRTILGAYVGDVIMSLVETSRSCGGNPFEYLVALHRNRDIVRKAPSKFFPWNYQENLPV